ncbi:CLUMA_CG001854, isoform A [Clunio marinus]|uniref:NADH dehydrogenase [ubiquinone] 1 beta subcomplex subunit 9 n=1 Tax=Clunio marinus TaxID=568069 RepID=A0A1J1HJ76_9DIPT|nr:CLUMA_CG001854, isoform A [Clunio marinus]
MSVSHTRRVQILYKRALRSLGDWYEYRPRYRYEAVLMRDRFDKNRNVKDHREIEALCNAAEQELFETQHPQPRKFPESPGGVAYEREVIPPDWILDYWHPLEKAQYPEFFARREQRKKEYLEKWDVEHGKGSNAH